METAWPSIAASASMPPTPQPSTPRPLIIVVCESVPTSVSGYATSLAVDLRREDHAGQVLQIHLVADAHPRRNGAEVAEGRLAPLQKRVALAVALKLEQRVGVEGRRRTVLVHLHRVVDHQLGRRQRIHPLRVAAQRPDGVAHRGQIDHRGHAGKVLHQHPRRHVGNLPARLGLGVPVGQKLNVCGRHVDAIFAAQQVFQQNLQAEGQPAQVEAARRKRRQAIDRIGSVAGFERGPAGKTVHRSSLSIRARADANGKRGCLWSQFCGPGKSQIN